MTARTPTTLKSTFQTGYKPTQADYGDIFDSFVNNTASAKQTILSPIEFHGIVSASAVYVNKLFVSELTLTSSNITNLNLTSLKADVVSASATFTTNLTAASANITNLNASTVSAAALKADVVSASAVYATNVQAGTMSAAAIIANTVSASGMYATNVQAHQVSAAILTTDVASASAIFSNNATIASANITTLNVGNVSADNVVVSGRLLRRVQSSIIAQGTTQGSAAGITGTIAIISTITTANNEGVKIPGGYPGWIQYIINNTTASAKVYPPTGGFINNLSQNSPIDMYPLGRMIVWHETSASFFTLRGT